MFEVRLKSFVMHVSLLLLSYFVYLAQNQVLSPQTKLRFIAPPPDQLESEDVRQNFLEYTIQTCWKNPMECKVSWVAELVDLAKSVGCKSLRVDSISGRVNCVVKHTSQPQLKTIKSPHPSEFERKPNLYELEDEVKNNIQVDDEKSALKRMMMMREIIKEERNELESENRDEEDEKNPPVQSESFINSRQLETSAKKVPIILVKISQATEISDKDYHRHHLQRLSQQQSQSTRTRALRSGEWADPSDIEVRNSSIQFNRSGNGLNLDGTSELRGTDVMAEGVTLVSSSRLDVGDNLKSSSSSRKDGEVSPPDLPLECELRYFTYQAQKTDDKGNTCTGLISTSICYGGCDTGEIADWLFPHKKSIHKICSHGLRMRRTAILPDCTEGASYSLREYHYVDAGDCACQKCYSSDTTCLGSPVQPNLTT